MDASGEDALPNNPAWSLHRKGPPGAIVFLTVPIPFAIREPTVNLDAANRLGWGVALWLNCDAADAVYAEEVAEDTWKNKRRPWCAQGRRSRKMRTGGAWNRQNRGEDFTF